MSLENAAEAIVARPKRWTIVRQGPCHAEVFAFDPDGKGESLAVFGFEEEAGLFLGFEELDKSWHVRETTTGELISVLYGPRADLSRVVLDPLPRGITDGTEVRPLILPRDEFIDVMAHAGAAPMPALAGPRA